jgi:hypothetical protein
MHPRDPARHSPSDEIKPGHRARLLELAATRGEKGFSAVVNEALELYLRAESGRAETARKALTLKGSFSDAEARRMRDETKKIRARWR